MELSAANINAFFILACEKQYFTVAEWLYSKYKENIDVHFDNEYIFRYACINGHLKLLKWFIELTIKDTSIDIHINDEDGFVNACICGHLHIMKYLFRLSQNYPKENPILIDYRIKQSDSTFILACELGHNHIAKWLYRISRNHKINNPVDIHAEDDVSFYSAFSEGHTTCAKWLIRMGVRPISNHKLYWYWQLSTLKKMLGILALIRLQKKWMQYLYNPNDGLFFKKKQNNFEKLKLYLN